MYEKFTHSRVNLFKKRRSNFLCGTEAFLVVILRCEEDVFVAEVVKSLCMSNFLCGTEAFLVVIPRCEEDVFVTVVVKSLCMRKTYFVTVRLIN